MAEDIIVFVSTDMRLEDFASILEKLLSIQLRRFNSDGIDRYFANLLDIPILVVEATDYEADQGIDFPRYSMHIFVGPLRDDEAYDARVQETGLKLASDINKRRGFATMVTRGMQTLLVKHDN